MNSEVNIEVNNVVICSCCGVNPVSQENIEEEVCSSCLEEQDPSAYLPRELNFNEVEGRKDDRVSPQPIDWEKYDEE